MRMCRSYALVNGRDYVIPDDVKTLLSPCLSHRIVLKPDQVIEDVPSSVVVKDFLNRVPVPK